MKIVNRDSEKRILERLKQDQLNWDRIQYLAEDVGFRTINSDSISATNIYAETFVRDLPQAYLPAGQTSLTITSSKINEFALIDVYYEANGITTPIKYKTISITDGAVTLTFDPQPQQILVGLKIDEYC